MHHDISHVSLRPASKQLMLVHNLAGEYVFLSEAPLRRAGMDPQLVYGRNWRDFSTMRSVAAETAAVAKAIETGRQILIPRISFTFEGKEIECSSRISYVCNVKGEGLIFRESVVAGSVADEVIDVGDDDFIDTLTYFDRQLREMMLIAKRENMDLLSYLLEMAALQVVDERKIASYLKE